MRLSFSLILLFLIPLFTKPQNWTNLITGSEGEDITQSVAADKNGNTYTLISQSGFTDYSMGDTIIPEEYRCVFCKHAPDGERLWIETPKKCPYQGIDSDEVMFLAVDDSNDIYMAGLFIDSIWFDTILLSFPPPTGTPYAKMFIVKYDEDGNALWAKCADDNFVNYDSYVLDIAIGPGEKLYLLGESDGPFGLDGNNINGGVFLLILDREGNVEYLDDYNLDVNQIEVDSSGNYYFCKSNSNKIYSYSVNHYQINIKEYDGLNAHVRKIKIGPDNRLYAAIYNPQFPLNGNYIERLKIDLDTLFTYTDIYGNVRNILFSENNLITVGYYFFDQNYAPVLFQKFDYSGNYLGHRYEYVRLDTNDMSVIRDVQTVYSDTNYISLFAQTSPEPSGVLFADDTLYPDSTPGIYTYILTSRFFLDSLSPEIPLTIQALKKENIKVSLYPNPGKEQVILELKGLKNNQGKIHIEVLDINGKQVYRRDKKSNSDNFLLTINTVEWETGIYIFKIQTENQNLTAKYSKL